MRQSILPAFPLPALLMIGALCCHSAIAAVAPKTIPQSPPADDISAGALNVAVRAALATGAENLLRKAETNYLHLAVPPISTRKVIGWDRIETNVVHYRSEEYEVPKYEYTYENYETFAVGASGSVAARKVGKVTKRRVVGRKQIGTKTRTRRVRDPDGPIAVKHTRGAGPQFGPGSEFWPDQAIGDNALAMLALLKAGVPESDERFRKLVRAIGDYVQAYGAPDQTRSLALLAAAFANLSDTRYRRTRDLLISRVLDGQIATGAARGMWGPVCINMQMLPVLVQHESGIGAALAARKKEIKARLAKTTSDKERWELSLALENEEARVKSMEDIYRSVTQQGMRFDTVQRPFPLKTDAHDDDARLTAGLPYYFYNQSLGDLESTAIALYALQEAARNDCLPGETQVPTLPTLETGKNSRRTSRSTGLKPQNTSGLLARAVAAIAAKQDKDGGWGQCNLHQEERAFEAMGLPRLLEAERPTGLPSERTRATVAQGYGCLINAGKTVGIGKLMGKYGRNTHAGRRAVTAEAIAHLDRTSDPVVPLGRILQPYDLYFAMLGIHRSIDPLVEDRRDLWMRFAHEIVELQHDSGAWEKRSVRRRSNQDIRLHPSSLWAWKLPKVKAAFEARMKKAKRGGTVPFDPRRHWSDFGQMGIAPHHRHGILERTDPEVVASSLAMLFLADGVHPPIGGYVDTVGTATPPTLLRMAFSALKTRDGVDPTVLRLTGDNIATLISSVPVVFLAGPAALDERDIALPLKRYMADEGLVAVECSTRDDLALAERKLQAMLTGSSVRPLPEDAAFMTDYKGTKPFLKALYTSDGRIAALFIPPSQKYAQAAYLVVRHAVGPEYLDPQYPILYFGEDPFSARVQALAALRAEPTPPPAEPTIEPVVPDDPATPGPAAPPAADATPEDELW